MNALLQKPSLIRSIIGRPPTNSHVLIIDDEPVICRVTQRLLEKHGFVVHGAANGQAGLQAAHDKSPDLVLLDLKLPDINGFIVLQLLKSHQKTAHVPVLMITGQADPDAFLKTASAGQHACGFLSKPFTAEGLLCRVRDILGRKGAADVPVPSADELKSPAGRLRFLRRGAVIVDVFGKQLWINGRSVLAPTERRFDLLCVLMRIEGPISRKELLLQLWDEEHDIGIVGMTAMRLRKDLRACPEICIASSRAGYEVVLSDN